MERLRTLTTIVWMIAGLLVLELGMLVVMFWPGSFYLWASIGIIAILCLYLVRLSLSLLAEQKKKESEKK
ncbi:hypothetical protein LJC45_00360 [Alistipes sp. OttesenSCG-928-B03]|nr:hypothetical protein [Alistipes sp. OttesenSCG-928-B03]